METPKDRNDLFKTGIANFLQQLQTSFQYMNILNYQIRL